jgi:hypothetical protein
MTLPWTSLTFDAAASSTRSSKPALPKQSLCTKNVSSQSVVAQTANLDALVGRDGPNVSLREFDRRLRHLHIPRPNGRGDQNRDGR